MDKRLKGRPDLGKDKEPGHSVGKSIIIRLFDTGNKAREKRMCIINYFVSS